jgi:hypothetical protein
MEEVQVRGGDAGSCDAGGNRHNNGDAWSFCCCDGGGNRHNNGDA